MFKNGLYTIFPVQIVLCTKGLNDFIIRYSMGFNDFIISQSLVTLSHNLTCTPVIIMSDVNKNMWPYIYAIIWDDTVICMREKINYST